MLPPSGTPPAPHRSNRIAHTGRSGWGAPGDGGAPVACVPRLCCRLWAASVRPVAPSESAMESTILTLFAAVALLLVAVTVQGIEL